MVEAKHAYEHSKVLQLLYGHEEAAESALLMRHLLQSLRAQVTSNIPEIHHG